MRPALPLLAVLAGCGPVELAWEDIPIVDWTGGDHHRTLEDIHEEVTWMSEVTGTDTVAISRIALVPRSWLSHRAHYNPVTGRILIGAFTRTWVPYNPGERSDAEVVRHELCHGLDATLGFSETHVDELTWDLLGDYETDEDQLRREAEEVFALLCEAEPRPDRIRAAVDQACGGSSYDPASSMVHGWAFPDLIPQAGPDVEVDIAWVDTALAPDEVVYDSQLVDGVLWVLAVALSGFDLLGASMVALDPATGDEVERRPLPEEAWEMLHMVVSADLMVVFHPSFGTAFYWTGAAWLPARVPVSTYEAVAYEGVMLTKHLDDPILFVVDPVAGTVDEESLPRGAREVGAEVHQHGDRVLLTAYPDAWERDGDEWVPVQGPQHFGVQNPWLLLDDGRTVLGWWTSAHHGLAVGYADGTLSLPADPCQSPELGAMNTDGEQIAMLSDGRIGLVTIR